MFHKPECEHTHILDEVQRCRQKMLPLQNDRGTASYPENVCGTDASALESGGEEVGLAFLHCRLWLSNKQLQETQR